MRPYVYPVRSLAADLAEVSRFGKIKDKFSAKVMISCRWDCKLSKSDEMPGELS